MNFCIDNVNLILLLPLLVCGLIIANGLTINSLDRKHLFILNGSSSLVCLVFSICVFYNSVFQNINVESNFLWLSGDNVNFYLGTLVDNISAVFLLISAIAFFLVQIYSWQKLKDDINYNRLTIYLNLFTFGLFGIFLASNILQSYMMCEVVGAGSYLLINFDFSNREESRAAIKSYIFNRIGDLTLLFCVITILYFAVTYNQLLDSSSLAFSNMNIVAESINSLMPEPLFVGFCSVLIFVILMKFMQAFIYLMFESKHTTGLSQIIMFQNSLIVLIGIYLLLRLNVFFINIGNNWFWAIFIVLFLFVFIGFCNKIFLPLCKMLNWVEKYIVEGFQNLVELSVRSISYLCCKFQAGNVQTYLIYSFLGLSMILAFVLMFYLILIKI